MQYLRLTLKTFLVLILLFIVVGFFLPNKYSVSRSKEIQAPARELFDKVNNLKAHESWDPWKGGDSRITYIYDKITEGKGARLDWKSEITDGGYLTILESIPPRSVEMELVFYGSAPSRAKWTFESKGADKTLVTASLSGNLGWDIMARYIFLSAKEVLGSRLDYALEHLASPK